MYKLALFLFFIFSFSLFNTLYPQEIKPFGNKGIWELGGTIYYSSTTPVISGASQKSIDLFQIQPVAGYFVYKAFEIGVKPTISITKANGNTDTKMSLYLATAYNFIFKTKFYPVITILLGYTSQSNSDSSSNSVSQHGFSWGFEAGVKINLLGNSLLFTGMQFTDDTFKSSGASKRNGQYIITLGAGWTVWF
jgi:hypothetical protein